MSNCLHCCAPGNSALRHFVFFSAAFLYILSLAETLQLITLRIPSLVPATFGAFGIRSSMTTQQGIVTPIELPSSPMVNGLEGEYRAGYPSSTDANDVLKDEHGQPAALSGAACRSSASKRGLWSGVQQQMSAQASDSSRGLTLFANATLHDKKTHAIDHYAQAGLVYEGPSNARVKDDIGFAAAAVHVNPAFRKSARLANLVHGIDEYATSGVPPVQDTEHRTELRCDIQLANWLALRSCLQCNRYPGGVVQVDDARMAGLKLRSNF